MKKNIFDKNGNLSRGLIRGLIKIDKKWIDSDYTYYEDLKELIHTYDIRVADIDMILIDYVTSMDILVDMEMMIKKN